MKYEVTLEFDEDWTIIEIKDMLHQINLDFFCRLINVKEIEDKTLFVSKIADIKEA